MTMRRLRAPVALTLVVCAVSCTGSHRAGRSTPSGGSSPDSVAATAVASTRSSAAIDQGVWSQVGSSTASPPPRDGQWMTFDPRTGATILFAGKGANSKYFNDVWLYESRTGTWTMPTPKGTQPLGRFGHAMVYASSAGEALVFGGATTSAPTNELWAYRPTDNIWRLLSAAGTAPAPRLYPAMGYDPISGSAVVFGGWTGTSAFGDTWVYASTSNTWTEIDSAVSPPPRWGASLVYDPVLKKLILFGGLYGSYDGSSRLNDTWAFDVTTSRWTNLAPAHDVPAARGYATMVYDTAIHRTILFGGFAGSSELLDDLWSYDAATNTWMKVQTSTHPSKRDFSSISYDTISASVFLFGGLTGDTGNVDGTLLDDTWKLKMR
jgi:hypothetical protein